MKLSLLDVLTIIIIIAVLVLLAIAPPANAQVAYPKTSKIGKVSVTVPSDSDVNTVTTNSAVKRTQTTYHVSRSLDARITVVSIEFKDVNVARPRLTEFLTQFIANYGSVDHLATIKDDGRKGMDISTEIYHDKSQT